MSCKAILFIALSVVLSGDGFSNEYDLWILTDLLTSLKHCACGHSNFRVALLSLVGGVCVCGVGGLRILCSPWHILHIAHLVSLCTACESAVYLAAATVRRKWQHTVQAMEKCTKSNTKTPQFSTYMYLSQLFPISQGLQLSDCSVSHLRTPSSI